MSDEDLGAEAEAEPGLYQLVEGRYGRFLVNPNDRYIGQSMIRFGEWSEVECRTFIQAAREGGVVVEVGSNIGTHTVALARKVGPKGRVHAFEPQPVVFQNLCANLALNHLTNVYAYNMAVGGKPETIRFPDIDYTVVGNFGGVALAKLPDVNDGQLVQVTPLDAFELKTVHLLKIDAEGMEPEIIAGAAGTIARCRPALYLENSDVDRSEALIASIRDLGYRLWWHLPLVFNADNWAAETDNPWPGIGSCNMLCVHGESSTNVTGMQEIVDVTDHPMLPKHKESEASAES